MEEIGKCGECPFWRGVERAEKLGFLTQEAGGHPIMKGLGVCFAPMTEQPVRCDDWPPCGWMMQSYDTERRHKELCAAIEKISRSVRKPSR